MKKTSIVIIVLVVLVGGVFLFSNSKEDAVTSVDDGVATIAETPAPTEEKRIIIQGHKIPTEPLVVPVGTAVVFENRDSFAGLPYDSHTITTGVVDSSGASGIPGVVPNSGSGNPDGLIDASLDTNREFSFTFGDPGSYTFYIAEHPNVSGQGQITITAVEEMVVSNEVVEMESQSFSFSPDSMQAQVGEPVRIDVTAVGQHTFTIDELGVDAVTPHGQTTRVEFTPDKPGTYEFYCAIPGHRQAGQVGTITVE